jgi:gamma-tubulin complex component 5
LDYAAQYVHELAYPPKPPGGLTWAQILAEDPLEGQHWEGAYGLPPGNTPYSGAAEDRERWSSDSEGSLGSGDDFQLEMAPIVSDPEDTSLSSMSDLSQLVGDDVDFYGETDVTTRVKEAYEHKKATEALQKRQYWRAEWKSDIDTSRKFDLGDASTLGPAVRRVVAETSALKVTGPENEVKHVLGVRPDDS